MGIKEIFALCGGLAFFLYGMNVMSTGLEKMAGSRLETIMKNMTASPLKGIILGIVITVAMQSSSATTVMLVGLVNSGIMTLPQTVGVMLGSNIGTTLTSWILSLTAIDTEGSVVMEILNPSSLSLLIALIGIILIMLPSKKRRRDIGGIMVGFSVLMLGMEMMSGSVDSLSTSPQFTGMLTMFSNPIIALLIATAFTGIIQSSAATVGIVQTLAMTGTISYEMAIPLVIGANIGTCATAIISSVGTNKNAKRVAATHIYFKIIGGAVCIALLYVFKYALGGEQYLSMPVNAVTVAVIHSIFNVFTTVLVYPIKNLVVKFARLTIRDKKGEVNVIVDERLVNTPVIAISECTNAVIDMAHKSRDTLAAAIGLLDKDDKDVRQFVVEGEDKIDEYEDKLGTFLVKLSSQSMTANQSGQVASLLHTIGDLERISDHATNVLAVADEMYSKNITFSDEAKADIDVMKRALFDILELTVTALETGDLSLAKKVEPLEEVIDELNYGIKARHITRLQNGACTLELGFVLSDLLTNFERVSDHCSNIAVNLIQSRNSTMDNHIYVSELKNSSSDFAEEFAIDREKYKLPEAVEA